MSPDARACRHCFIKATCPPQLLPETTNGDPAKDPVGCRQFTCLTGRRAAMEACTWSCQTGIWKTYQGYVDGALLEVLGAPFSTEHKSGLTRFVDETGAIWSEQDDVYYPTGQEVEIPESPFA